MHDSTAPLRASVAFQAPRGTQAVNLRRKKKSDAHFRRIPGNAGETRSSIDDQAKNTSTQHREDVIRTQYTFTEFTAVDARRPKHSLMRAFLKCHAPVSDRRACRRGDAPDALSAATAARLIPSPRKRRLEPGRPELR
ncbi:unnamed protein product, partial [Ixodes pacificus]